MTLKLIFLRVLTLSWKISQLFLLTSSSQTGPRMIFLCFPQLFIIIFPPNVFSRSHTQWRWSIESNRFHYILCYREHENTDQHGTCRLLASFLLQLCLSHPTAAILIALIEKFHKVTNFHHSLFSPFSLFEFQLFLSSLSRTIWSIFHKFFQFLVHFLQFFSFLLSMDACSALKVVSRHTKLLILVKVSISSSHYYSSQLNFFFIFDGESSDDVTRGGPELAQNHRLENSMDNASNSGECNGNSQ